MNIWSNRILQQQTTTTTKTKKEDKFINQVIFQIENLCPYYLVRIRTKGVLSKDIPDTHPYTKKRK